MRNVGNFHEGQNQNQQGHLIPVRDIQIIDTFEMEQVEEKYSEANISPEILNSLRTYKIRNKDTLPYDPINECDLNQHIDSIIDGSFDEKLNFGGKREYFIKSYICIFMTIAGLLTWFILKQVSHT